MELKNFLKPGAGVTEEEAYKAGYDCAVNGPNTSNCHFSYFGSKELTKAWERGKQAGDETNGLNKDGE